MARRKIEEVEPEMPGTPGGEALGGVAGGSTWQSLPSGQDGQSDISDGEGAYAPESVDANEITQDPGAADLINALSAYFEAERVVDASEQGEGRSDGSVSGSAVSLDNTASSKSTIDPPSPPPSQPVPPSPPTVRRRKRSEPTSRAATDIFHDLSQSESDRDPSPMQLIPRPRSAPLAQKAIARTEAATRQRPGGRGDNGIHKSAWRLSAAPLKLQQSPFSPQPCPDEQVDPAAYRVLKGTDVLQDFIDRQEALERDRQQLLAKRRLDMRSEQQKNCRPGVWLRQARRYFKSDGRTEASEPAEDSFLRRMERRREAKRLAEMKQREERDMQLSGGGGGHSPCVNRRSKELLARRQRLARGRAQAFQRLYTSSKCYRAEKIVSSILLDKSALSDAPRKLRTRRRRSSLLGRRNSERRASDGSMVSLSEASYASDDATSVDLAVGYTREDQAKTFSRALRERLRARIEVNKLRLENREVMRAEGVEPPPLRTASQAAGIPTTPPPAVGGFRKKSQKLFRKRVENEVAEVLKEHGQEDTRFVTRPHAEQILRRLFVLPHPDEFAKWHSHEGDAEDKGEGRRQQERLIEMTWAFLQTLTTFELGYAPLPGMGPSAHPEVGEEEEGLVSLEAVVVLCLRVATQGMQTLRSPSGELYYLTSGDVTLLTQLRRQHLLLRLAHKARPNERRVYQPPGTQTRRAEDSTQNAFMSKRSKQLVEKLMRKNAEKLRELNIEAPDVYHSWLTEGVNLKAIKRALGPLGGDMAGTCSSTGSRVVDLCNVLAYSAEVQGLRRESERVARLQEEMRTCTFTPRLNKKTLHLMKGQGRQPLSPDTEGSSWQDATSNSDVRSPLSPSAYRPDRHNALYKEGTRKLKTRREQEQQRDPDVLMLRQLLDQVRREKGEPVLTPAMTRTAVQRQKDDEKRREQEARQKEQCVEREATIKGLVKELQQEGYYTPHLPNYDPEAAATRLRATLYETMASDSVKSYQTVVDRIRRGAEQRKAKFVYVEQLRVYHSASDDSDNEARTKAKHRTPQSPRKANTVLAPFNLSPRRELPSHIKAHEREEQMAKEKEEEAARHRQHAREQFEASTQEAMNMPPPTPSYSQYFHGEKALGGGTRTAFEATDPLLFVDVVLSGDRNKIRVPVCRGDSPKQVAKDFGRKHNLSNEAVHLLEVTFRTHMAQTLRKELSDQSPGF